MRLRGIGSTRGKGYFCENHFLFDVLVHNAFKVNARYIYLNKVNPANLLRFTNDGPGVGLQL